MNFIICSGGMVTVINSEGKPTQVPATSLNMSGVIQGGASGLSLPSSLGASGIYFTKLAFTQTF